MRARCRSPPDGATRLDRRHRRAFGAGVGGSSPPARRRAQRSASSWPMAAIPSGLVISVTIRRTPLMTWNHSPRSTQRSRAMNVMPEDARMPALMPPHTEVMPAR